MYDLIKGFIDHTWDTSMNANEQYFIYGISCVFAVVFVVVLIDLVRDVFSRFLR